MNMQTHSMSLENMPVSSSITCQMLTQKEQAFEAYNISVLQQCTYLFNLLSVMAPIADIVCLATLCELSGVLPRFLSSVNNRQLW